MTNLMKEIPFADTLGPVLLAAILWSGAHIFLIAPIIIAPRLTQMVYQPQCETGIEQAWHKADIAEQSRLSQLLERKRAELRHKRQMAERMIEQSFGPLGQHLKQLGMFNALDALEVPQIPDLKSQSQNTLQITKTAQDYCGCIISNLLGNQIATGFYSASFRFWKPENIQKLEALGSRPVKLPQCSVPGFLR